MKVILATSFCLLVLGGLLFYSHKDRPVSEQTPVASSGSTRPTPLPQFREAPVTPADRILIVDALAQRDLAFLAEEFRNSDDPSRLNDLAEALALKNSPEALKALLFSISDRASKPQNQAALSKLHLITFAQADKILIEAVSSAPSPTQTLILPHLARLLTDEVLDELPSHLGNQLATETIVEITKPARSPSLTRLFTNHSDRQLRETIFLTLAKMEDQRAISALAEAALSIPTDHEFRDLLESLPAEVQDELLLIRPQIGEPIE